MEDVRKEIQSHVPITSESTGSDTGVRRRRSASLKLKRNHSQRFSWVRSPLFGPKQDFSSSEGDNDSDSDEPLMLRMPSKKGQTSPTTRRRSETLPAQPSSPLKAPLAKLAAPPIPQRPKSIRSHSHHHARDLSMTTVNLTSQTTAPPSPSIRSSSRASSHTDLSSLVDNWASSGPANVTLHYQHTKSKSFLAKR